MNNNNRIDLNTVPNVQTIEDNLAENHTGGNFVVDFGDFGTTGTTAPFLITGNSQTLSAANPLETINLRNVDGNPANDSFSLEYLDGNNNVVAADYLTSSETASIPGVGTASQPTSVRITQGAYT